MISGRNINFYVTISVRVPVDTVGWFGINDDLCSRWIKGICIEVKNPLRKLCMDNYGLNFVTISIFNAKNAWSRR